MNVWLYHINPDSPAGWEYGWEVSQPDTLMESSDRVWPAGNMFRKVAIDDIICIYTKNIQPKSDGVYVIGRITQVMPDDGTFRWQADKTRSARTLMAPISSEVVRRLFGRSYGSYMQQLPEENHRELLEILRTAEAS